MGILNVTPDSFFDQGRFYALEDAIQHGKEMCEQGADLIDIGGESTRPGAPIVDEKEELKRVIPVIKALHSVLQIPISIDTRKPIVAVAAVEAGASMINDVSGFRDPAMQEIAASADVDICVMHMQGTPQTMQKDPKYPEGVVPHIMNWFECQVELLIKRGVKEKHLILDPGVGFGKTVKDNLEIIQNLSTFKSLGFPILVGISRKWFIGKILNMKTSELLGATLAFNAGLLMQGVDMIRVHDVKEHRNLMKLLT